MKKILFYGFVICSLISCSSPEKVAKKALADIGRGLYVRGTLGISLEKVGLFTDHADIFSNFLINSDDAKSIIETGYKKDAGRDGYFMTDILFEKYELISKKEIKKTMYDYSSYNDDSYSFLEPDKAEKLKMDLQNYARNKPEFYKEIGDYIIFMYENVPYVELKYKLDNKYIATIITIKVPDEGYRVCAFWMQ